MKKAKKPRKKAIIRGCAAANRGTFVLFTGEVAACVATPPFILNCCLFMANTPIVVVAGGSGNLGGRIVKALLRRGAQVRALVRPGTEPAKLAELTGLGVEVVPVKLTDPAALQHALTGAVCVVSALQGLRAVIVDGQTQLLDAAVAAGVPRFIPSDFAVDYMDLKAGDNRNFDLRREFHQLIDQAPIRATSIFNGSFDGIFAYGTPLYDAKKQSVGHWGNPDWKIDFSTMDDAAAYTAAAALDAEAPRALHIASFQLSAHELVAAAKQATGQEFTLAPMGTVQSLLDYTRQQRAAHPEGEHDLNASWQGMQYLVSMLQAHSGTLDNDRYPGLSWATPQSVLQAIH